MAFARIGVLVSAVIVAGCQFERPENVPGPQTTLSVVVSGAGMVSSTDGRISTSGTQSANYDIGATVALQALWDAGRDELSWSGACSGVDPLCTVRLDQPSELVATFTPRQFTLAVAIDGVGEGRVTSSTTGVAIDCGVDCDAMVPRDTVVTLTAAPTGTDLFFGWNGGVQTGYMGDETVRRHG